MPQPRKPKPNEKDREAIKGGYSDVAEWGDKDISGAYPDGTTFQLDGVPVDVTKVPDILGGKHRHDQPAATPKHKPQAPGVDKT